MQLGAESRRPAKDHIRIDELGTIGRNGIIGCLGRNHKAPDIPLPGTVRISFVNLVDSPIVRCSRDQTVGVGIPWKTGNIKSHSQSLVTPERIGSAVVNILEIVP